LANKASSSAVGMAAARATREDGLMGHSPLFGSIFVIAAAAALVPFVVFFVLVMPLEVLRRTP